MIGLGSNRLTVCRRGGMSVTQAGRGGMEWLAGGRMPSWASPYSAQATAALKAQFPTQWPTIRDYGFAHPEIVGYMNAYAPEDAKIAYSLVPTLGVIRWLVGDGIAYIITPMVYNSDAPNHKWHQNLVLKVTKNIPHSGYADYGIGGEFTSNVVFGWFHYYYNGTEAINFAGSNIGANCVRFPVIGEKYDMYGTIENGTLSTYNTEEGVVRTTSLTPFTTNNPLRLFRNRGMNNSAALGIAKSIYEIDDVTMCYYIPFKTGKAWAAEDVSTGVAQAAGTCGMIDLLTGIFYPNANSSGSFTISETPSS